MNPTLASPTNPEKPDLSRYEHVPLSNTQLGLPINREVPHLLPQRRAGDGLPMVGALPEEEL